MISARVRKQVGKEITFETLEHEKVTRVLEADEKGTYVIYKSERIAMYQGEIPVWVTGKPDLDATAKIMAPKVYSMILAEKERQRNLHLVKGRITEKESGVI